MEILERPALWVPATKAQEKFWKLRTMSQSSNDDNIPICISLGPIKDPESVKSAFSKLICRHEALRTTFRFEKGQLIQLISSVPTVSIATVRIFDDLAQAHASDEFMQQLRYTVEEPFNYVAGPLIRAFHMRFRNIDDFLLVTASHIIADGNSLSVLERDIHAIISSVGLDRDYVNRPVKQFRDIAAEQCFWRSSSRMRRQHDYWLSKVSSISPSLAFPLRMSREAITRHTKARVPLKVSTHSWQACCELAIQKRVTFTTMLLTALVIALAGFATSDHVVIGMIYSNRARREDKNVVGLLMNGLPMKFAIGHDPSAETLIEEVFSETMQSMSRGEFPIEEIADETGYGRGLTGGLPPLWEVAVNFSYGNFADTERSGPESSMHRLLRSSTRRLPKPSWDGRYIDLKGWYVERASMTSSRVCYNELVYNEDAVEVQHVRLLAERISQIIESIPRSMATSISKI